MTIESPKLGSPNLEPKQSTDATAQKDELASNVLEWLGYKEGKSRVYRRNEVPTALFLVDLANDLGRGKLFPVVEKEGEDPFFYVKPRGFLSKHIMKGGPVKVLHKGEEKDGVPLHVVNEQFFARILKEGPNALSPIERNSEIAIVTQLLPLMPYLGDTPITSGFKAVCFGDCIQMAFTPSGITIMSLLQAETFKRKRSRKFVPHRAVEIPYDQVLACENGFSESAGGIIIDVGLGLYKFSVVPVFLILKDEEVASGKSIIPFWTPGSMEGWSLFYTDYDWYEGIASTFSKINSLIYNWGKRT